MGKSLSRNLARNGFNIAVYNRHVAHQEENIARDFVQTYPEMREAQAFDDLESFVQSLECPRKIIVMVNAGPAVDDVLGQLSTLLEVGDIVIDGGNSHFQKTTQRMHQFHSKGIHLLGMGVSGGERGALEGPSIMPSGDREAYAKVAPYLSAIAAKDSHGDPCYTYVGEEGSGHFVKMIHNGIEYVEMQLLAECYFIMKSQAMSNEEIAAVLASWTTDANSYLLQITIAILRKKEGNNPLLDYILDKAGNKGTGKWASIAIMDTGQSATMIPTALLARHLSFFKTHRQKAASVFATDIEPTAIDPEQLHDAYCFARMINHHQGFDVIHNMAQQENWQINRSEIARIWTEGCIITSDLMKALVEPLKTNTPILYQHPWTDQLRDRFGALQQVILSCVKNQLHVPCLLEAYNYFNGLKTAESSANMIQAQRDYFGAHTYQRKDDPSGKNYHTNWEE